MTRAPSDRDVLTKLTASDLRAEAEKLIRSGKIPSLGEVLDIIREVTGNPKHTPQVIQEVLVRTKGKKQ